MKPLLCLALLTTACTPALRVATPPPEYLSCADWPSPPDMPAYDWTSIEIARVIARQRDLLTLAYEQAGYAAFGDCKADVNAVAAWVKETE